MVFKLFNDKIYLNLFYMDVIKLKSFIAVAKLKNFRKASEELFFSQPAISAQIKELENYYNIELFERKGKRIDLTEAGELLLPYAEDLVRKFEESRYNMQNAAKAEKGRIKIGTSILPGIYYIPDLIAEFKKLNPEIVFEISLMYSREIEKLVLDTTIHIGIIGTPEDFSFEENLVYESVFKDSLLVCVYKEHPFFSKESVSLAELSDEDLILPPQNTYTRKIVEKSMKEKRVPFKIAYEIGNNEMIKRMVEKKLGITVLCSSMLLAENCRELKGIAIEDLHSFRHINMIFRKDRKLSLPLQNFINFIRSHPQKYYAKDF